MATYAGWARRVTVLPVVVGTMTVMTMTACTTSQEGPAMTSTNGVPATQQEAMQRLRAELDPLIAKVGAVTAVTQDGPLFAAVEVFLGVGDAIARAGGFRNGRAQYIRRRCRKGRGWECRRRRCWHLFSAAARL